MQDFSSAGSRTGAHRAAKCLDHRSGLGKRGKISRFVLMVEWGRFLFSIFVGDFPELCRCPQVLGGRWVCAGFRGLGGKLGVTAGELEVLKGCSGKALGLMEKKSMDTAQDISDLHSRFPLTDSPNAVLVHGEFATATPHRGDSDLLYR